MNGKYDQRLERLERPGVLPLAPTMEQLLQRVAADEGIDPTGLRAEYDRIAAGRPAGATTEQLAAIVAAELGIDPAQLLAEAEALVRRALT